MSKPRAAEYRRPEREPLMKAFYRRVDGIKEKQRTDYNRRDGLDALEKIDEPEYDDSAQHEELQRLHTARERRFATVFDALIHELTTIWDVAYTAPRRDIKPREHHTHSFLEVLPFVVAGLIAIRPQKPEPGLRPRTRRLPEPTILALYAGAIIFGLVPHLEELARCARAGQSRSS